MNHPNNFLKLSIIAIILSLPLSLQAQDSVKPVETADAANDSVSLRPSFSVDFTGEIQSDFKRVKFASLLELGACIPLSRNVSIELSSVSFATTREAPLIEDLQVFSNLDADNLPFTLSVAGVLWNFHDYHTLFAGLRRVDEDYFCSDVLSLFTNSSCGGFPTITANYDIASYPVAGLGIHYMYDRDAYTIQASVYNGRGYNKFTGRENMFRFCPEDDGIFALLQGEYRYKGSSYFLGGSLHYGDLYSTASRRVRPVVWAYAEQAVTDALSLVAAYSHAFSSDNVCRNFCGIGGKYAFKRVDLGLFSDYTRIEGVDEWATEITCNIQCTKHISLQPAIHVITTGGKTNCVGLMRMAFSL
ncbi:MAG: hypothetical protein ACI4AK_02095 [Lepagella sp.]